MPSSETSSPLEIFRQMLLEQQRSDRMLKLQQRIERDQEILYLKAKRSHLRVLVGLLLEAEPIDFKRIVQTLVASGETSRRLAELEQADL
jgi:hypothetical protein